MKSFPQVENLSVNSIRIFIYDLRIKNYNLQVMGFAKLKTKISVENYLAGEEISPVKYEYVYGEVYATAGTSDNHNRIVGSIYAALLNHLRNSPCEPFMGDIKVRVSPHVYYYPDVLVSC